MDNQPEETNSAGPANNEQEVHDGPMSFDPTATQGISIPLAPGALEALFLSHGVPNQDHVAQPVQHYEPPNDQTMAGILARHREAVANHREPTEQQIQNTGAVIVDIKEEDQDMDVVDEPEDQGEDEGEKEVKEERVSVETIIVHGQTRKKFKFSQAALDEWFGGQDPYAKKKKPEPVMQMVEGESPTLDIITALCNNIELAVELGKHLRPKDVISLYSANRAFHNAVKGHLLSSVRTWISYNAPEAGTIFNYRYYKKHLTEDPMGRTYGEMCEGLPERLQPPSEKVDEVRTIPGLKYLQLVVGRDRFCHDILALMARSGHRMPATMHSTLLRLWLFMDVATTSHRRSMMHSTYWWRDVDLYNAQFFFIKLGMHFNDPIFGPNSFDLVILMLGQQGLYPLWQLLAGKKYTNLREILCLKAYYDLDLPMERWNNFNRSFYGCPYEDMGTRHCEGWGLGHRHLVRPDELVPQEAVARGLGLERHLRQMAVWGYFSWTTGENLMPTEEELYIEDEEDVVEAMDTTYHWKPKHALKKRWATLTEEERQDIIAEEDDERLRALAFANEDEGGGEDWYSEDSCSISSSLLEECLDPNVDIPMSDAPNDDAEDTYSQYDSDDDDTPMETNPTSAHYNLEEELKRGYVLPQITDDDSQVPVLDDKAGWGAFVDEILMQVPVELDEDFALKAQAWQDHDDEHVDWGTPAERALAMTDLNWRVDIDLEPLMEDLDESQL